MRAQLRILRRLIRHRLALFRLDVGRRLCNELAQVGIQP